MANAEHLKILKSGVEKWNKWRENNKNIVPDLSEMDEPLFNFGNANLEGVNLNHANLPGAKFSQCNLSKANFTKANLGGANFFPVIGRNVVFNQAMLESATFIGCDLSGAEMREADLIATNFTRTVLPLGNLSGSRFDTAFFEGSDLTNADFSGTALMLTRFSKCKLYGVKFFKAQLTEACFTNIEFGNVNFAESQFGNTIISLSDLNRAEGLTQIKVFSPCTIDFQTLRASRNLPKSFLLKIGLPELFIDYLPEFYSDALNFYTAFLSHSWANKDFARKLYEALITKGVNVFFDEKKMKPGDDIYESISKGISHYDKMILVCSKESLSESWWVDRELDRILKKERDLFKERGQRTNLLIPINLDDFVFSWDGAKAEEVRRYVIGDFRDWQDEAKFEMALNDLIHALNADRPDVKPKSLL